MTQHTPAPWRAVWDDNGQWYIEPLGITGTKLRGDSGECVESANAHLIEAAPDLLEACKLVQIVLRGEGRINAMLDAAIRKAEGEGGRS